MSLSQGSKENCVPCEAYACITDVGIFHHLRHQSVTPTLPLVVTEQQLHLGTAFGAAEERVSVQTWADSSRGQRCQQSMGSRKEEGPEESHGPA